MATRRTKSTIATGSQPRQLPGPACEECRKRKLRCDRQRPACSTCAETGVVCDINTNRLARGPKKGDLKALRNRVSKFHSAHTACSSWILEPRDTDSDVFQWHSSAASVSKQSQAKFQMTGHCLMITLILNQRTSYHHSVRAPARDLFSIHLPARAVHHHGTKKVMFKLLRCPLLPSTLLASLHSASLQPLHHNQSVTWSMI